jgi:hypothetical protein
VTSPDGVVVLLDCDNTLLDNDLVQDDLRAHLTREFGGESRDRYWAIFEQLRAGCDLDLLLFFARHPRVVLSSEQLAAYVGYDLQQVARSLDLLVGAGVLRRSINQGAVGRMYVQVYGADGSKPIEPTDLVLAVARLARESGDWWAWS